VADKESPTIQITCSCCGALLTVDASLPAVLSHKLPAKPPPVAELKDAVKALKEEASRRDERYQQILEAEKSKGKILDRKFQELLKKAKEEPLTKPLKDIDLD
jgi:electron transfer flavoprotein alpha/beta subunit